MTYADMDTVEPPSTTCPESDLADAHRAASLRDPRSYPFGYLAGDPDSGALAPMVWFATADELIGFLRETEVALLQFEPQEAERILVSIDRVIGATRDPRRFDCGQLSAAFEGWCEILWAGTFADLCTRGGSMQKSLRLAFRRDVRLGEHAGPIADEEIGDFVDWLREV
jgi:hypothetical protein